jgi:hypothetical protein
MFAAFCFSEETIFVEWPKTGFACDGNGLNGPLRWTGLSEKKSFSASHLLEAGLGTSTTSGLSNRAGCDWLWEDPDMRRALNLALRESGSQSLLDVEVVACS